MSEQQQSGAFARRERERIARLEKEDAARPVKENDDDDDWRREWETTKKVLTHRVTF